MNKVIKFLNGLNYTLKVSDDKSVLVFRTQSPYVHHWIPNDLVHLEYQLTMRLELNSNKFTIANLRIVKGTEKQKAQLHKYLEEEFPKWYEKWQAKYPMLMKTLLANRDKRSALAKLKGLKDTVDRIKNLLAVAESEIATIEELL